MFLHPHLNYIVDLLSVAFKISKVIYNVMILVKRLIIQLIGAWFAVMCQSAATVCETQQ